MKKHAFYKAVFNSLPAPSLVMLPDSPNFTILEVNDAYLAVASISREELIGKSFFDTFPNNHHEDTIANKETFLGIIKNKVPSSAVEGYKRPIHGGEGLEIKYYNATNTPYLNEKNEVEFIVRSLTDYSEVETIRSKEEAAKANLIKNEKLLNETQRIARVGSWEVNLIDNKVIWSEVVKEIHELDLDYVPTLANGLDFYKEGENRERIVEAVHEAIERGSQYDLELEIITAKRNGRWVRTTGVPEIINGKCIRIFGAFQDITERKNIEKALLESKNQLQSLIQTVEGIVWEYNIPQGKTTFVNEKVGSIIGFTPKDWIDQPSFLQNQIHPDDREEALNSYQNLINGPKNATLEYRFIKADGSTIWVKDRIVVIKEDGNPKWFRGLMVDNTLAKISMELEHLENKVFHLNTQRDVPVAQILTEYLKGIEALFPQMAFSVYKVIDNYLNNWSSPSLPEPFIKELDSYPVGDKMMSCGTAVYRKEPVIVSDIAQDPEWSSYKDIALAHDLLACWSYPIIDSEGKVMASLGVYCKEARVPEEEEVKVIERLISLLKVILENRQTLKILQDTSLLMKQGQELANLGNWQWDVSHNVVKWSESLYRIYGLDQSSFISTFEGYLELVHPEDAEMVAKRIKKTLKTKSDTTFEERIIRPDGEIRYLKSWCKVILNENNQVTELIGACLDITEIKTVQLKLAKNKLLYKNLVEELKTSNERYEYVNKATNDAIYDWDILQDRIHWGDGFFRLFGYERHDALYSMQGWMTNIHPMDYTETDNSLRQLLEDPTQNGWTKEYRFLKANKAYAYVEENGYVLRDSKGKAVRMIGVKRDITSRKRGEEKMKDLHNELERNLKILAISNAELEQFAHVVSHDLQEPLRMITSFLAQLERRYHSVLDEKGKKYIHFAVDGARRMRQIILDLLNFSKVGKLDEDREDVDLNMLLEEILLLYKRKIIEEDATVEYTRLPTLHSWKTLLRQIFQSLINNSLLYQKKENKPYIKISYEETATHWKFTVDDNGIGIDKVYYDKIFLIFQRLQLKEDFPGTGMGLAVTKKIIKSLGGDIWVESKEGSGSKFLFTLAKHLNTTI